MPDPTTDRDMTRSPNTSERRMTLRLPDDAWKILDALAPEGDRCALIAYFLRCEAKRQGLAT